uniref:Class I SAM-dependent methyltransferase n=1 Tax=Schlesneria paludicola TaxID=360056 RepID=A0A7C2JZU5_9PLAN
MLRRLVQSLAARPWMFDLLRWTLEAGYRGHHHLITKELQGYPGPVLDIGCGTGVFAHYFDPAEYLGVDVCAAYVAAAQRRSPGHRFAVMDARRLDLADGSQGLCFISGVLHHLSDEDAHAVLSEVARVLQPTGRLAIWEDIPTQSWWNPIGPIIHRLDLGDRIRTPTEYLDLIEPYFALTHSGLMRSGWMDYAVYLGVPKPRQTAET